ncbi:MAG: hypothetical protein M9894_16390 [Planctomycetes bacterium]|nr:hypothetical protein [Planctomycetota bacterium]
MIRNVYEESKATIVAKVKRGKLKKATVKFTFTQEGGAAQLEAQEVTTKGTEAVLEVTLPKVKDDEDSYSLSCSVEADGQTFKHPIEYVVWPKSVELVCKDGEGNPAAKATLNAVQKGGVLTALVVADKDGKIVHAPMHAGTLTFTPAAPFELKSWVKEKGTKREATVARQPWTAKILKPVKPATGSKALSESGKLVQFVNLEPGTTAPPNSGAVLEVEVGPEDASLGRAGDELFVKCTFSKKSKRTTPKPQLVAEGVEGWKEADEGKTFTGKVKLAEGGRAKFKVCLGNAGGETWKLQVGQKEACDEDTLEVETWRRLYVQVQRASQLTTFDMEKFFSCMKEVFILPARLAERALDKASSPGKGLPVWIDGAHCGKTSGKGYLLAGDTSKNAAKYEKLLDVKQKIVDDDKVSDDERAPSNLSASVVYCDEQVDFSVKGAQFEDAHKAAGVTLTKNGSKEVTKIELKGKKLGVFFYARGSDGKSPVQRLVWGVGDAMGEVPADKVTVTYSENDGPVVAVDTSADADFKAATKNHQDGEAFLLGLLYEEASIFNGEAFGDRGRHLLVSGRFGSRAAGEVCGTMAHELGHALNMSLSDGYDAVEVGQARKDHGFHYQRSGNHCAFGMSKTDYAKAAKKANFDWASLDGKDLTNSCKCVMYGYGGSKRSNSYCEKCAPFLLAHDVKEFKK